jgi:hypothetical protein
MSHEPKVGHVLTLGTHVKEMVSYNLPVQLDIPALKINGTRKSFLKMSYHTLLEVLAFLVLF